jgi:hypothetical protein
MIKDKPCILCNAKTKWLYFQELLNTTLNNSISLKTDDDMTRAIENFNYTVQQTAWSAIPTSSKPNINIEYSPAKKN